VSTVHFLFHKKLEKSLTTRLACDITNQ